MFGISIWQKNRNQNYIKKNQKIKIIKIQKIYIKKWFDLLFLKTPPNTLPSFTCKSIIARSNGHITSVT